MKRIIKNVINIIVIIAVIAANSATIYYVKNHASDLADKIQMKQNSNISSVDETGEPEDLPDNKSQDSIGQTPPEKPEEENEIPDGEDNEAVGDGNRDGAGASGPNENMQMSPDGNMQMSGNGSQNGLDPLYYIIFAGEGLIFAAAVLYFIMSKANQKGLKATFKNTDKIIIFILAAVILTAGVTAADGITVSKLTANGGRSMQMQEGGAAAGSDASGAAVVEDEQALTGAYTSSQADESVILVQNGGNLILSDAALTKTGDSSNTENSEFYGINAGLLVTESSTATISNANISTDATGSNAVFATGTDAKIYISDSTVTTTGGSSARGLDATYGGYIEADNVTITTQGGSCAALATDRGEGTVIANNSNLTTNGAGSPVIYSTGDISIDNTTGTANGAQLVVVEGKNSAAVENSTLTASGTGNRNNVDHCGVMIYQSMSGDASEGTGSFTAKNASLSIMSSSDCYSTAPMFFVTNTNAVINLGNTKLAFGSNLLLSVKGTDEWGTSGSNGGSVVLNAENQTLSGNIELDNISSLTMNLTTSKYEGTINADNTAEGITLVLDADSEITLTGDSYITSLENADSSNSNINLNGYTLYINGTAL